MYPIKIDFIPQELEFQKPIESKNCFLHLYEDHLKYQFNLLANEPTIKDDPDSGWNPTKTHFKVTALKSAVVQVELSLHSDQKTWGIYLSVSGSANDIRLHYKDRKDGLIAYDTISSWLLNKL